MKVNKTNSKFTWKTMFGWQLGPENEIGFTRKTEPDGTTIVEASILQAAAHASSKACQFLKIRS